MRWLAVLIFMLMTSAVPADAQSGGAAGCSWTAGEVWRGDDQMEGISTCSSDAARAYLALGCAYGGEILVQYDLAKDSGVPFSNADAPVVFATEKGSLTMTMASNEMDGLYELSLPQSDGLFELLASSQLLTISDEDGVYPARQVSLKGSRAAIGQLIEACAD